MKLTFLGTKGYIKIKKKLHKMHTSLLISDNKYKIMIDCGEDWLKKLKKIKPDFILLTHAHPDHAFGLKNGADCPIYATKNTFKGIKTFPLSKEQQKVISIEKPFKIGSITFTPFSVQHSVLYPAIGYKISKNKKCFFYVPDVLWIKKRKKAFQNISFYIGDGATIKGNLVRKDKKTQELYGHANIRQQLTWCKKEKIKKMIITHCGSDIVGQNEKTALTEIKKYAKEREVDVEIAYDGKHFLFN